MLRNVLAFFAGFTVCVVTVAVVEGIGMALFPPPPDLDPNDPAALAALMDQIPLGALVSVVVAWGLAALLGPLVAGRAATHGRATAGVVGALFLVVVVLNLAMLPHPIWMWVVGLLGCVAATAGAIALTPHRESP